MTTATPLQKCRSCGASIVWLRTRLGKAIPYDVLPVDDKGQQTVTHFATCPHAAQHRKTTNAK